MTHHIVSPADPKTTTLAGARKSAVRRVILVIDVQGALLVRERVPNALLVFIQVPGRGLETLEARLRARGTDDDATIRRRLDDARRELALADRYDVQLFNDNLDQAVEDLASVLTRHGCGG